MKSSRRLHRSPLHCLAGMLLIFWITGCTATNEPSPSGFVEPVNQDTLQTVRVIDDIPYREGSSPAWRMDVAIPQGYGDNTLPAIVIIHGGGWRTGSRQVMVYRSLLLDYAFQGYVTASVDYRLTGEAPFPACIEDVKCAVRYLRAHADLYRIDPDRIGAFGHSAGAHLALMLAVVPPTAGLEGDGGWDDYSSAIQCVVGGSTPVEPGPRHLREGSDPAWWPTGYISDRVPPILLIHGTDDQVVDVKNVDDYIKKLKEAGATDVEYLRVEGGDHGVAYQHNLEITKPAMDAFFERNLKE